jgi:hypothetical protein
MKKKYLMLILPVLLIATTSVVFYGAAKAINPPAGYLIGFLFYWTVWCLLIPAAVFKKSILYFFRGTKKFLTLRNLMWVILFGLTIVVPFFTTFIKDLSVTPRGVILLAVPLAAIHGFCEELFWRGLYVKEFPTEPIWAVVIPSVFFAAWHVAPQFAVPAVPAAPFILSTLPLGLTYALVSYFTKSAFWSAIGHSISGILAFSGLLAPSLYTLLSSGV